MSVESTQIGSLLAEGRHAEAAAAARAAGDPGQAAKIYERIWDFRSAAACAREAGDLGGALRNLIDARALDEALALGRELAAASEAGMKTAADVFESRRMHDQAGALFEKLGDLERAAAIFQRGGHLLDAARALEALGRPRDAGRLYERSLGETDDPAATARAHLGLGRLLGRLGHHEEAAAHLQVAGRAELTRAEGSRLLVVELAALGLRDAAQDALVAARAIDPELPTALDQAVVKIQLGGAPSEAAAGTPSMVGGRYRLLKLLGQGGSGRVYLARDEVSGAEVAVKLFYAAHARGHEAYERFVREARIWGKGRHPNIVDVLDFREELGFFVMEYLAGGTLATRLTPRLPPHQVRRLGVEILNGLTYAHARGVVHRDIKPANIFFDTHGTAKIGDFGVAHLLDLGQTQTGALIGTLAYMSPEQVTGAPLTASADLYSLGITLFQALTGRLPFLGPDFVAQHLGDPPPRPSEILPELPAAWDDFLALLLTKDPEARPSGADEVSHRLAALDVGTRRAILVLPRGRTADELVTPVAPAPAEPPAGPKARYQEAAPFGQTPLSTLSRALDTALQRSVILERFHEGALDPATEARLLAMGAASTPYLQRILGYDRAERLLVYEAPVGESLAARLLREPLTPRIACRLLLELGLALAPLHQAGAAHGAVALERVLIDEDGESTLLCAGLGPAEERSPAADVGAASDVVARAAGGADGVSFLALITPHLLVGATLGLAPAPAHGAELAALAETLDRALAAAERIAAHVGELAATSLDRATIRTRAAGHGLPRAWIDALLSETSRAG